MNAGLAESLNLLCRRLEIDRVSLHAVDQAAGTFRVVASAGSEILADGTELPLETSTQVMVPAAGRVFRTNGFRAAGEAFDRPLDQLVIDMGYRSGCSIPLFMGSRPVGTLCASSRLAALDPDPVLEAMDEASAAITLALRQAEAGSGRVLVCIDDDFVAQGIARVIERGAAVSVETYSTNRALTESDRAGEPCEAVICDVSFDGVGVDGLLASLRSGGTHGPALVLASRDSPMSRSLAQGSGAAAYVPRSAGVERLLAAVRALLSGDLDGLGAIAADGPAEEPEIPRLTGQEGKILALLERGLRFKQIALELDISESTAKGYARNLFAKLDAHSRSEAVYIARNRGQLDFLVDTA